MPRSRPPPLALLLLLLLAAVADGLKLRLSPYQMECVTELVQAGDVVSGSFVGYLESRGGGFGDGAQKAMFDLEVKTADGYVVYRVPHRQDAKFDFTADKAGRYFVCLRNYGRHTAELLYHSHVGRSQSDHGKLTAEHLEPVKGLLRNLRQTLQDMLEETMYQERRDNVHHATNENTDRRTLRWGVVEALACVVLSVSQIVYVRRLFKSSGGTLLPRFGV